jgi:hypothetical protein
MNDDSNKADEALIARAQAAVDREVEGLDAATRARLNAARRSALAELEAPRRGFAPGWVPVGAAAAVAVIAVGVALGNRGPAPEVAAEPATELEVLLADDELALFEEELEFYTWLDEQALGTQDDAG